MGRAFNNPAFEQLRHVEVFSNTGALNSPPASDHLLLYDLVQKALVQGRSPFTSYAVERQLIAAYGAAVGLAVCSEEPGTPLDYAVSQTLIAAYNTFADG